MLRFIVFYFVWSVLVCKLLDDGRWLPKHVGGITKLCAYCVWKCWFKEKKDNLVARSKYSTVACTSFCVQRLRNLQYIYISLTPSIQELSTVRLLYSILLHPSVFLLVFTSFAFLFALVLILRLSVEICFLEFSLHVQIMVNVFLQFVLICLTLHPQIVLWCCLYCCVIRNCIAVSRCWKLTNFAFILFKIPT